LDEGLGDGDGDGNGKGYEGAETTYTSERTLI